MLFPGEVRETFQDGEFVAGKFAGREMETSVGIADTMTASITERGEEGVFGRELSQVEGRNPFGLSMFAEIFAFMLFEEGSKRSVKGDVRAELKNGGGL